MRSEKLSALGQMISGAAHELNNPLGGIYGYSQLLLEEELPTQVRSDLEVILKETKRCQNIIKNLLTFARKHDSEREPIDTNEVINSVLELQSYQLKVDGIDLEEELDQNLPKITGDYHQLQQVFVHLINNANHALKESKKTPKKLAVHSKFVQDSVQIKISDNGVGISNENMNKIFDPFFTTKEVGEGTGLGLSICFGIVESHQGKLFVDSTPGQGSTFTLELPLAQASPQ
ncbi:HAMP domain-containing histidine kinase [candidate division KSB1 bacterium]|nr:HAMP domain-containing histidine kinase [candidate division KSB1 bacterium]